MEVEIVLGGDGKVRREGKALLLWFWSFGRIFFRVNFVSGRKLGYLYDFCLFLIGVVLGDINCSVFFVWGMG